MKKAKKAVLKDFYTLILSKENPLHFMLLLEYFSEHIYNRFVLTNYETHIIVTIQGVDYFECKRCLLYINSNS
jgi:hypothetical protein